MKYDIYQIRISDEVHNYVNSNDRGHTGAAEKYPSYNAKMNTMHSRSEVDGRYNGLSSGDMDYTIKSKDEVFGVLNQQYLDEDTMEDIVFDSHVSGYNMKSFVREGKTIEYRDMHSLSVGDIIAEVPQVGYEVMEVADIVKQTRYFIVEGFGFSDITDIISKSDIAVNRIKEAV